MDGSAGYQRACAYHRRSTEILRKEVDHGREGGRREAQKDEDTVVKGGEVLQASHQAGAQIL